MADVGHSGIQDTYLWNALRAAGLLLMAFGIATCAYTAYAWASKPSGALAYRSSGYYGNPAVNQSGFNQSGLNYTGAGAVGWLAPEVAYIEGVAIGILMALLGFATYKYSGLKSAQWRA